MLAGFDPEPLPFARDARVRSGVKLLVHLVRRRPDLVVMEGTGVAGGAALILARLLAGIRYVVSSGDAVAPFVAIAHPWLAPLAAAYERLLCRHSDGVIGWTPYLVGRALTLGAPRGMTAAGWPAVAEAGDRDEIRAELGIPSEAIVFGLVGKLAWEERISYCYGLELVRAIRRTERDDLRVLVVGGGDGLERLREAAGPELSRRVILTDQVPSSEVRRHLAAIDVATLPQSVDGVGSFRYATKTAEYLGAGLPVVTSQIPMAYDLDGGWLWRLPGAAPWDESHVEALADLMRTIDREQVASRAAAVPTDAPEFDRERQRRRVEAFLSDLLAST